MHSQQSEKIKTAKCQTPSFFIDTQSVAFNMFSIKGNNIKYIDEDETSTQLFGNTPISAKNYFSVKVTKTKGSRIAFGVADSRFKIDRKSNFARKNIIFYYGQNGYVFGDGKVCLRRSGFKKGQTVTIRVDQEKGEIQWEFNGVTGAKYQMENLKDKSIEWVPYVYFYHSGDEFKWID